MFIGISAKNIRRTPGKTLLFALLIFSLTLLFFLCVYTYAETRRMLYETKKNYITIAEVELTDSSVSYSDINYSLFSQNGIWQPSVHLNGLTPFGVRTNDGGSYKNSAVLIIGNLFYDSHLNLYIGTVYRQLSGYHDVEKKMIYVLPGTSGFEPVSGMKYIVHCEFVKSQGAFKSVKVCPIRYDESLANEVPYAVLTDPDAYISAGQGIFFDAAAFYNSERSRLVVCPVQSLESNVLFHQQIVYMISGQGFDTENYSQGAKVCVISEKLAKLTGLSAGDTLPLFINSGSSAPGNDAVYENYTITGIIHTEIDLMNYVFVPEKAVTDTPYISPVDPGQTLGQVVLKNGEGSKFLATLAGNLSENMLITVYDHGYESIVRVLDSMITLTFVLSIVSALAASAVLALYAYLFVYRQRDTVETMVCLGTPKRSILTYLIFGSGMISLVASAGGAITGTFAGPGIFRLVFKLFASLSAVDTRFSDTAVGVMPKVELNAGFYLPVSILVPLAVFIVSLSFCLISAALSFGRKRHVHRAAKLPKPPKQSSLLPPSPLRYSLLSVVRGRARSLAVPALAAILTIFLSTVAYSADSGERRINEIYAGTVIRGHITDLSGKMTQNLAVSDEQLENLKESGYFENISTTMKDSFMYLGVAEYSDGRPAEKVEFKMPRGFALENFIDKFYANPSAVFTRNLDFTPGFITYAMSVDWAEGYDENNFVSPDWEGTIPCVVTRRFAEEKGVGNGDVIRIILTADINMLGKFNIVDAFVAGICENAPAYSENIYFPLAETGIGKVRTDPALEASILADTVLSPEHFFLIFGGRSFSSVYFTLRSAFDTDAVKDYLYSAGYSCTGNTGKLRMSIQLEDKQFYENLRPARQQTQYMNMLFPLLFAVSAAAGIAVFFLITGARREEIAIMRGMGASKKRTFLSFFWESTLLSALGATAGWLLFLIISRSAGLRFYICLPGFILLYLTGAAISIFIFCRSKVSDILRNKE